jgi:hypothetical protein
MRKLNPFLQEGLTAAFSRRAFRRTYNAMVAGMAVFLVLVWPKGPLADFLRGGRSPQAFQSVAIALLLLLSYLGGRNGLQEYARDAFTEVEDLAALSAVRVRTIVGGRFLFAALHAAFLLCLGLPFLTVSLTVSGYGLAVLCRACLLVFLPAFAVRAMAVFLTIAADLSAVPRNLAVFAGTAALFLGTAFLLPAWCPILLLAKPDGPPPLSTLQASFFHLLLVLCFLFASLPAMALRRRRAGG